jgi:hypothetical protein
MEGTVDADKDNKGAKRNRSPVTMHASASSMSSSHFPAGKNRCIIELRLDQMKVMDLSGKSNKLLSIKSVCVPRSLCKTRSNAYPTPHAMQKCPISKGSEPRTGASEECQARQAVGAGPSWALQRLRAQDGGTSGSNDHQHWAQAQCHPSQF